MTVESARAVVLVVENEPNLRMVAVDLVQATGFAVQEAASAEAAIAIIERRAAIRIMFAVP